MNLFTLSIGSFLPLLVIGNLALAKVKEEGSATTVVFAQQSASTFYRAVFAQFLSVIPNEEDPSLNVDSALSISNVCAAPDAVAPLIGSPNGSTPETGRVSLFLYGRDSRNDQQIFVTYTTGAASPGTGLTPDGKLGPGETWTVRLAEVLAAALGKQEGEVQFNGYGWVLSEFDCLAGTYSNTIFGLGFTQSFELLPAMGQGGFFGGVMIPQ